MAQVFFNQGLTAIFNQLLIPTSGSTLQEPAYYVGLFTGLSGTTVPDPNQTLYSLNYNGYEIWGSSGNLASGYSRQPVTWNEVTTATSYIVPDISTTTSGSANIGDWFIGLSSTAGVSVGMTIDIGFGTGVDDIRVITGINGSLVTLSSPISNFAWENGTTVYIGDSVNGQKSTGNQVTFTATGSWPQVNGYFITDSASSTTSGNIYFAANFADGSATNNGPTLGASDTLKVTPTWLLSN